jgi:hypothetical protein
MVKLKAGASNWCEIWVPQIINAKLSRDEAFRARYSRELGIIESNNNNLMGLAALYWKYKTDSLFLYRERGFPVFAVSYESLVTVPRAILFAVCDHLGVPFHDNLLRHQSMRHTELFANGLTVGNTVPNQAIQSDSVGQWKHFLSDEDLELVERISGDLPAKLASL